MPNISIWQFNSDIAVGTSLEDRTIKIFQISTGELVRIDLYIIYKYFI
jgi:hypothetical protein